MNQYRNYIPVKDFELDQELLEQLLEEIQHLVLLYKLKIYKNNISNQKNTTV
jgi:hypothetical protein